MSDTPSDVDPGTGHPEPELLSAFVDGNLEPAEAAAVREHLVGCAVCRPQVEDLRLVREVMRGLPFVDPPFGFYERTLRLGPRPRSTSGTRLALSVVLGIVALAAVLIVVAVVRREPDAVQPTMEAAAVDVQVAEPAPRTTQAPPTPTSVPVVPDRMPPTIAGYQYVGQRTHEGDEYLVYANGSEGFAVTWDEGELELTDLPAGTEAVALAIGADGDTGWYVPAGDVDLAFVQRGDRVYTVVAEKGGDVGAIAAELPAVDDEPSPVERAQSVGRSLLEAFGLGG